MKIFNDFFKMTGLLKAFGLNPSEAKAAGINIPKPHYVKGDHFYQYLSFKRIKGKWRVKR